MNAWTAFPWLCALAAPMGAPAAAARAPQSQEPEVPRKIVYGADRAFRPFEWTAKDGNARGFQIDLIRAIGAAMGTEVEVRIGEWSDIRRDFEEGRVDIVGMFDRASRHASFDFAAPFSVQGSEIFVRRGSPPILSLDALAGKEVLLQAGALAEDEIRHQKIAARVFPQPTEDDAIRKLASGEHDCAVTTQFGGRYAIRNDAIENVIAASPLLLKAPVAFAVRKGDAGLLWFLDEGLVRVKTSGAYNEIYDRWFRELDRPALSVAEVLKAALWVAGPLLFLLGASFVWTRVLKRRVAARTRELDESLERFRVAIQSGRIMVFHQDRDLRYTWVFNSHPGITTDALLGKVDAEILPASIRDVVIATKKEVLATGRGARLDLMVPDALGGAVFEVVIEALRNAKGEIYGLTSSATDITERKAEETGRLRLERRLAQAEKLETLGLLAGGVAHDFNNLLLGIGGHAALAARGVEADSDAGTHLEAIEKTVKTASDLTRQLLNTTGRGPAAMEPVDVGAAAAEIAEVMRGAIPARVELRCELAGELPKIRGNGVQIRQVLMNLVKNGADAIGESRGKVVIRASVLRADRRLLDGAAVGASAPAGDYVCVEVSDDGAGMDAATLARATELFHTNKPEGHGIGLAVVVGAVQRHRGALLVESAPGRGTTFRVLLPLPRAEEAASQAPAAEGATATAAAPAIPKDSRTVLVVDDHSTVRDVICETFARAGCTPIAASDGAEAMAEFRARTAAIDCVVLDLTLPDMSGLEVFVGLRKERRDARVILTSGVDEHNVADQVAKDPRATFLQKPFTPRELVAAFEALMRA